MIEISFHENTVAFMKKAYSYLRFSHPSQATGDSIRRQVEGTKEYCKRNGFDLDETLKLRDEGVSAFSGEHRSDPDRHALAYFLKLANEGKIEPNSYLIIENLDRLSRESTRKALALFLSILDKQINIVQLHPETIFDHQNCHEWDLMRAILELSRGHSESSHKARRVGDAWQKKRNNAEKLKLTAACPSWLTLSENRTEFEKVPAAVEIIKRIFKLCIDGYGIGQIASKLNAENVPPIGRADYWANSYVSKILRNRAVLGEYQPFSGRNKTKRKPSGEPILDYFPQIISNDTFYAAQSALKSRKNQTGPTKGLVKNLFTGLLFDGRDKGSLTLKGGAKDSPDVLVSYLATMGKGTFVSFPYPIFEQVLLNALEEIDPKELDESSGKVNRVEVLSAEKQEIEGRLTEIQAALESGSNLQTLLKAVASLETKLQQVNIDLEKARLEASSQDSHTLIDVKRLLLLPTPQRVLLKSHLRRLITSIWAVFHKEGAVQFAYIQVNLKSSCRLVLIRYRPPIGGIQSIKHQLHAFTIRGDRLNSNHDLKSSPCDFVYDDFKMFFASLDPNNILEEIVSSDLPIKEKHSLWKARTGLSISEFYRKVKARSGN